MGYNTTIMIHNDGFGQIRDDKDFGRKVYEAAGDWNDRRKRPKDGTLNIPGTPAIMLHQDHADNTHVLAVGGNYGTDLGVSYTIAHSTPEQQVRVLEDIAEKLGYKLTKIRKPAKKVARKEPESFKNRQPFYFVVKKISFVPFNVTDQKKDLGDILSRGKLMKGCDIISSTFEFQEEKKAGRIVLTDVCFTAVNSLIAVLDFKKAVEDAITSANAALVGSFSYGFCEDKGSTYLEGEAGDPADLL